MRRKRVAVLAVLLLAGLLAVPVALTWRQVRQERLNQALIAAIRGRQQPKIASLLEQGADPNARMSAEQPGSQQSPPGFVATVKNGWNLHNRPRQWTSTALRVAVQQGNLNAVRLLLDKGADPNARIGKSGYTVLKTACSSQGPQLETMRLLLRHGADVNARTESGDTPLSEAVTSLFGNIQKVRLLLDHGADVNAVDRNGFSILMWATVAGDDRIVALLLEWGADVHYRLKTGETALTVVRETKDISAQQKIVSLLKHAGASDANSQWVSHGR
jgi:ankyrin repeat protein